MGNDAFLQAQSYYIGNILPTTCYLHVLIFPIGSPYPSIAVYTLSSSYSYPFPIFGSTYPARLGRLCRRKCHRWAVCCRWLLLFHVRPRPWYRSWELCFQIRIRMVVQWSAGWDGMVWQDGVERPRDELHLGRFHIEDPAGEQPDVDGLPEHVVLVPKQFVTRLTRDTCFVGDYRFPRY